MQLNSNWVTEVVHLLNQSGYLRSLSYPGFLKRGRGTILCQLNDKRFQITYLCRDFWTRVAVEQSDRDTILNSIDTYDPSSQAIVVIWFSSQDRFEINSQLVMLN